MSDLAIVRFDRENLPSEEERRAIEAVFERQEWDNPEHVVISAFLGDKSVGILKANIKDGLAHVVYIRRNVKKLGIASQMHAEFERVASGRKQTADTTPDNNKAKFFFQRMGYQAGGFSSMRRMIHFYKTATEN